ncbi:hypothetical protein GY45DRAFT_1213215, partial [Cubamyces sp. BRFM 1775]
MQPFLVCALIMVCILHSLSHVARPYANFILATIKVVLLGCAMACNGSNELTGAQRQLLRQIPSDIRTAIKMLDLEPDMAVDASC